MEKKTKMPLRKISKLNKQNPEAHFQRNFLDTDANENVSQLLMHAKEKAP